MQLTHLSDDELIASYRDLQIEERARLVLDLEHVAELDRRKLFLHYASLRAYLVGEYGMEEGRAEKKIWGARLMNRFPVLKGPFLRFGERKTHA